MHHVAIDNFDEHQTEDSTRDFSIYKERLLGWESEIGRGSVHKVMIRPGLILILESFRFEKNVNASMEIRQTPLEIFFCLSGCLKSRHENQNEQIRFDSGRTSFFVTPLLRTKTVISAGEPLKLVTIRFSPDILKSSIAGFPDILPMTIDNLQRIRSSDRIIQNAAITPEMNKTLIQILTCPYQQAFRRIYLESKTLELITMFFARFDQPKKNRSSAGAHFTSSEIKRIHQAKTILSQDFENPPYLAQLARQVGMNKDKLNQGFQNVFGTTAFNMLKQLKMEKAKKLLEGREMNVTEVAYALGYSQPGTFSRAFRQHFGINPKSYSRRITVPGDV